MAPVARRGRPDADLEPEVSLTALGHEVRSVRLLKEARAVVCEKLDLILLDPPPDVMDRAVPPVARRGPWCRLDAHGAHHRGAR